MKKNKKAISPFIAAVILIIVAVAVGLVVANFIRVYIGRQLEDQKRFSQEKDYCDLGINLKLLPKGLAENYSSSLNISEIEAGYNYKWDTTIHNCEFVKYSDGEYLSCDYCINDSFSKKSECQKLCEDEWTIECMNKCNCLTNLTSFVSVYSEPIQYEFEELNQMCFNNSGSHTCLFDNEGKTMIVRLNTTEDDSVDIVYNFETLKICPEIE